KPGGPAAQTRAHIRKQSGGERKIKLAVKPSHLSHSEPASSCSSADAQLSGRGAEVPSFTECSPSCTWWKEQTFFRLSSMMLGRNVTAIMTNTKIPRVPCYHPPCATFPTLSRQTKQNLGACIR